MNYPNYPPQPQPGYGQPQYGPQPGYPQAPQPGYAPQGYGAPQGYAPPPPQGYGQPAQAAPEYDWGQLWSGADHTNTGGGKIEPGEYPATVTEAEWTFSDNGKRMFLVKAQITDGQYAGRIRTRRIMMNARKDDGSDNAKGLGWSFRMLAALGVPTPANSQQPFWTLHPDKDTAGQMAAASIVGKPCTMVIVTRKAEGDWPERDDWRDILPPKPGQPVAVQQQAGPQGYPQPVGPPQPGQGQPAPQSWQQAQAPQAPQGPPPVHGPGNYQGAPQWAQPGAPTAPAAPGTPAAPGPAPASAGPFPSSPQQANLPAAAQAAQQPGATPQTVMAAAMTPGAGGTAEFTQQGQSAQPGISAPAPGQNGQGQQAAYMPAPPPGTGQADPGKPPWAQ